MAYINKNDFSIVDGVVDQYKDDYFECDDLIAPAISLLNKKGYKTLFCCSGHPYPYIHDEFSVNYPISGDGFDYLSIQSVDNISEELKACMDDYDYDEDCPYKYYNIYKCHYRSSLYVLFADKYNFPSIPENSRLEDGNSIYFDTFKDDINDFDAVTKIYELNKLFYEWVESLDNIKEK